MTNDDSMTVPDPDDHGDDRQKRPRLLERSASVPLKEDEADTNVPHDNAASDKIQVLQASASDNVNTADDIAAPNSNPISLGDSPYQVLQTEALDIVNTHDDTAALDSNPVGNSEDPHQVSQTKASDYINTGDDVAAPEPCDQASTSRPPILGMGGRSRQLSSAERLRKYLAIAMNQSEANSASVQSDAETSILSAWNELLQAIKGTVMGYFKDQPCSWANLSSETQKKVNRWTPKAKEYLEDDQKKHYILEACIWHTIDEKLFSPDWSMRWAGGPLAPFGEMKQLFQKNFSTSWEFHRHGPSYRCWLMFSTMLITDLGLKSEYDHDTLARHIAHNLGELIGADDNGPTSVVDAKYLSYIAECAACVDWWFQHACFKYWVAWQPEPADDGDSESIWGFAMQDNMEHVEGTDDLKNSGQPVQIVLRPCLMADDQQTKIMHFGTVGGKPRGYRPPFRVVRPMLVEVDRVSRKE
ncbi:hypothetical protein QQZ08_012301 [Neonectria magnoliae]|uniref:Uncharacterized protein n=1 Tax=Neonectria magnoliae TaxID=2732573 RepID=A0ABR1H388_9HYPO